MSNPLRAQFSNAYAPAVVQSIAPEVTPVDHSDNPIWDRAVDTDVQGAVDRVLDYLRTEKIDLTFSASGNLVDLALRLSTGMGAVITDPALADDVRSVTAHMVSWMCDYAERAGVDRMSITLNPSDIGANNLPSILVADDGFQVPIVGSQNADHVQKQIAEVGRKLTLDLKMNAPAAQSGMRGDALAPGGGGSAAPQQTDRDILMFAGEPIKSDHMRPLARRMDLDFLRSHASQLAAVRGEAQQLSGLIDRAQGGGLDAVAATSVSPGLIDLSVINGPVLSAFDIASLLPSSSPSPSPSNLLQPSVWTGGQAAANDPVMVAPVIPLRADISGTPLRVDAPNMSAVTSVPVTPVSVPLASALSELSRSSAASVPVVAQPVLSGAPDAPTTVTSGGMAQVMAAAPDQPQYQSPSPSQPTGTGAFVADVPVQPSATGQSSVPPAPSVVVAGPEPVGSSAFLTPTSAVSIAAAQTAAMNENKLVASDVAVAVVDRSVSVDSVRGEVSDAPRMDAPVPAAAVASPDVSTRVEAHAVSVAGPVADTVTVAPTPLGDRSSVVSEIILPHPDARMPDHTGAGEIKGFDTPRVEVRKPDMHDPEIKVPEFKEPESRGPEIKGPEPRNPEFTNPEFKGPEFKSPEIKGPEIPVVDRKPNITPEIKPEITPDIPGPKIPPQPPVDRGSDRIIQKSRTKCKKGFDECHCGEENQAFEEIAQDLGGGGRRQTPHQSANDLIRKMREARANSGVKEPFKAACQGCESGNCPTHGKADSSGPVAGASVTKESVQSSDASKKKKTRSLTPD